MITNQQKSRACSITAGSFSVFAFVLYNWNNFSGQSHPNLSSWSVWAFITVLNFASYKQLTGDWAKSILPTANAFMCIMTAVIASCSGSFQSLGVTDVTCFSIGVTAGVLWKQTKSPSVAQIILQIAISIGFVPTLIGAWGRPTSEPWLSWLLWVCAFITQNFAVAFTWKGNKMEFLYPVNMLVFHVAVFVISLL